MIKCKSQAGAGIIEFIVVAIPILLISLGGIELAAWLNTRQTLSLALINAARAASSQHAEPRIIADAFENSLLMAYPKPANLKHRLAKNQADLELPWQIIITSPNGNTFADHKSDGAMLTGITRPHINNYYQDLQHTKNLQNGWLNGKGEKSGTDIFLANTLQLELTWPLQPMVPGIQQIIRLLATIIRTGSNSSEYHKHVFAAGYIPLKRNISISMQSHPVLWTKLSDGRVIYSTENYFALPDKNDRIKQANNINCDTNGNYLQCSQNIYTSNNGSTNDKFIDDNKPPENIGTPEPGVNINPNDNLDMENTDLCDLAI